MALGRPARQIVFSATLLLSSLVVLSFGTRSLVMEGEETHFPSTAAWVQHAEGPSSLQDLVDSSEEGATIHLSAGDYIGPVFIEKSVRLIGAGTGETVIHGVQSASAVVTTTSDREIVVEIENLQIRGAAAAATAAYLEETLCHGISASGTVHVILNNVLVHYNSGHGVVVSGQAVALIENSTIYANQEAGVVLERTASATMIANVISGNAEEGILVEDVASATIERHRILGNKEHGVAARGLARVTVELSLVADNREDGIHATDGARVELLSNEVVENVRYGIFAQLPANLEVCVDNDIQDNKRADCSLAAKGLCGCP
jgi:nitrous oxidase accessory protein NosD